MPKPRRSNAGGPSPRPEVLALLCHIKDNPEDEPARLVLADWLEEHAEAPAELAWARLTRVQCRLGTDSLPYHEQQELALQVRPWLGLLAEQVIGWHGSRGLLWLDCLGDTFFNGALEPPGAPEGWAWVGGLRLRQTVSPSLLAEAAKLP